MPIKSFFLALLAAVTLASCSGSSTSGSSSPSLQSKALGGAVVVNNIASFSGNRSNYTLTKTMTGYTVVDNVGSDGTSTLGSTVTLLKFADTYLSMDTEGIPGQVYRLYQAAFNRTPDVPGLGWWITNMNAGMSLTDVSGYFEGSDEFRALYGSNVGNDTLVTLLYQNVLHRTPNQTEISYWVNVLNTSQLTRQQVLYYFSESSENKSQVLNAIQNGIAYSPYHLTPAPTLQLAAGLGHGAMIKTDGSLWTWGSNNKGQLGLGDSSVLVKYSPVQVGSSYSAVAVGDSHTFAIKSDGTLWAWGYNADGQLGDGTTTTRYAPVQIGSGFSAIAAGSAHSLAIKTDGTLWAWGKNSSGQLGDGTTTSRTSPVQIGSAFSTIAAGTAHSVALKNNGTLWAWGGNSFGQIGDGTAINRTSPVQIGTGFTSVSANSSHNVAVKSDGTLWSWGENALGQVGDGTTTNRSTLTQIGTGFISASAGLAHGMAIKSDGTVWGWGSNTYDELDDGSFVARLTPTQTRTAFTAVYAGAQYTLGIKSDGTTWGWGYGASGLLGNGMQFDSPGPVQFTTALASNPLIRSTQFGQVQGSSDSTNSANAWLGIPYAQPPVGTLRWKAPIDPVPWASVRQTTQFGNACPQMGNVLGPPPAGQTFGPSLSSTFGTQVGSEDCLTLNIWAPSSGETKLPVVVFIYGGSNVVGWSGTPDYSGARLAGEQKVVFVSLNYRLNAFGWLNHSALKTGDPLSDSGNFGTLDLIQALKFVKNNISNFGGDPNNVTIAGQSAGSKDVWSLIASPKAAGLFHKAVPLSAGYTGRLPTSASVTAFATNLVRRLVINDGLASSTTGADAYISANLGTSALMRTYLYSKSTSEIINAYNDPSVSANATDVIDDGVVLPPNDATAFTGSFLNNVPVMSGTTNDEGKYWGTSYYNNGLTSSQIWADKMNFSPNGSNALTIGDIIAPQYLPATNPYVSCSNTGYNALTLKADFNSNNTATWCASGVFNTTFFWQYQATVLNRYQPLQPKTFAYNFSWAQQPEPWKTIYGAAHVSDVAFLFGNFGSGLFSFGYSNANQPGREALSLVMRKTLSTFMRTGDPNNAALGTTWQAWSPTVGGPKRLILNADLNNAIINMSTSDTPTPIN